VTRFLRRVGRALCAALAACAISSLGAGVADDAGVRRAALDAGAPKSEPAKIGRHSAPLAEDTIVVLNRPIVTFRAPFLGISPAERARTGRERIVNMLERGGPGAVSVEKLEPGDAVKIDGALVFVLTPDDVDRLGGQTFDALEAGALRNLERMIAETQEARSARLMLAAALWAAGATVVYLLLLWALARLGRSVTRRTLALTHSKAGQLRIGGSEILQRERALAFMRRVLQFGFWALVFLLTYEWLGFVLSRFPYTRPWGEHLNGFLLGAIVDMLTAVADAMPDLVIAIAIFFVAHGITSMLKSFFDGVQSGRVQVAWLDADTALPSRRIASLAVWIFALVMAYPYLPGSGTEAFKGLSVLVGLMVSIGASGVIGQAASGLILMYTRTYRPGEYVRVNEHEGTIVELGMFTSRLRTGLGEELTLPNALVLASVTRNYSRTVKGRGFILDTTVTIGYDAPWRQVHAMLIEAARRTAGVLADPPPRVFQTALQDFYVEYRLVCQAIPSGPLPRAEVLSVLHANVQDVFNEHGVQIMSPHYLGDPANEKIVPKAKWYAPPAAPPEARK
jgi:small-conductance mechanosensitive channel